MSASEIPQLYFALIFCHFVLSQSYFENLLNNKEKHHRKSEVMKQTFLEDELKAIISNQRSR